MIFTLIFWSLMAVAFILYSALHKNTKLREDVATIITVLAVAFLIVAIVTRDPIFSQFGVPGEYEWVVGLFIAGLTSWKLYFNPLKERVIKVEKDMVAVKKDISSIKEDVSLIKNMMLSGKKNINKVRI